MARSAVSASATEDCRRGTPRPLQRSRLRRPRTAAAAPPSQRFRRRRVGGDQGIPQRPATALAAISAPATEDCCGGLLPPSQRSCLWRPRTAAAPPPSKRSWRWRPRSAARPAATALAAISAPATEDCRRCPPLSSQRSRRRWPKHDAAACRRPAQRSRRRNRALIYAAVAGLCNNKNLKFIGKQNSNDSSQRDIVTRGSQRVRGTPLRRNVRSAGLQRQKTSPRHSRNAINNAAH